MSKLDEIFAPRNEAERQEDVLENLTLSIQIALQKSMQANCISQKELAERLGLTAARVSQMLGGNSSNLTLKSIARIASAIGEDFEFVRKSDAERLFGHPAKNVFNVMVDVPRRPTQLVWKEESANTNTKVGALAA